MGREVGGEVVNAQKLESARMVNIVDALSV